MPNSRLNKLFLLLFAAILLAGCAEKIDTARYYYSPSFTRDGNIIFITGVDETRKNFIGQQTSTLYREFLTTATTAGAGDATLFEVSGDPPYQISASPTGEYIAYLTGLRNNKYEKIVVRYIGSGQSSDFEKNTIPIAGLKSFDWSKDGQSLVYATTQEVRTMNLHGASRTLVTAESNLESVGWKYGDRIAFVYTQGGAVKLSLIHSDGTNRENLTGSLEAVRISSSNTSEAFGISGSSYIKLNLSTQTETAVKTSFSGAAPKVSPDARYAIYSKSGESSGIYLLDLASGVESKIK